MNKYLIELIGIQNSVILPGFGALMIGNSKSGKVVFNPLLKFNDGALAKFIAQKDGIELQAAQNQVAKFVREIDAELSKGNSFDIFQFGKFTKKPDGTIEFVHEGAPIIADANPKKTVETVKTPDLKKTEVKATEKEITPPKEENKPTASLTEKLQSAEKTVEKKTESVKADEVTSKQVKNSFTPGDAIEAVKSQTIIPPKDSVISKNIPLAEGSKKDPAAQEKNSFKPLENPVSEKKEETPLAKEQLKAASDKPKSDDKAREVKSEKTVPVKEKSKEKEKPKSESVKEKFRKDKPQKVKHQNPESKKPKKKSKALLWIIILLILGGGGAAGWFYKDEINHFLFAGVGGHESDSLQHENSKPDSLEVNHSIEPIQDDTSFTETNATEETEIAEVEEVVEEKPKKDPPVKNNTSPGGTYHIIGNAFSSETNAENYVKKMNEKGYSAKNIGKYNGLYLVSLKSFGSREEAKNNLSSVKSDADGAYVFAAK